MRPRLSVGVAEAGERGGHDLLQPTARLHVSAPALQPAHVEQVADEAVEPVGLLVDGREELRRCAGVQSTSCCRRLVADALIDGSGVRRSWETARRRAVRSASVSASGRGIGGLGLQPPPLERDGSWAGRR